MEFGERVGAGILQLVARARSRGWHEVADLAKERVRGEISSGDTLLFLVRDAEPIGEDREGLLFREARRGDGVRYARDIGTDSATTFKHRLSGSTRCFVVETDGRIVHASWVTTDASWARELRARLIPPRGDAYVYESFTRSDVRGRGIYPFALRNIVGVLASEGIGRVWIAVEEGNAPSRKAIDKAGFQLAFQVTFERRWGRLKVTRPEGPEGEVGAGFIHPGRGREK